MFGIGHLFGRIQSSFAREALLRGSIAEAIKKNTGIEIPIVSINIKSSVVSLSNISQAAKSVIFIKKQQILKDIQFNQQNRQITDIR